MRNQKIIFLALISLLLMFLGYIKHCISIFLLQYAIFNLILSVFIFDLYMDLLWCSVNGKATGEKCKIQQPCGMKNCKAQCQGVCDASGGYLLEQNVFNNEP